VGRYVSRHAALGEGKKAVLICGVISVQKPSISSIDSPSRVSCVPLLHILGMNCCRITADRFDPGV
jgi:hypothetical protein